MAFTKFAHYDVSEILEVKGSSERVKTASFSKVADFEDFRTEDGYLYARIRAISSRVNKNHDGWPSVELAGGPEVFEQHRYASEGKGFTVEASAGAEYGFSTFLGKPIFVDHHNSDPSRARGVIVDAKLHVEDQKTSAMDPYYSSADCDPEHQPATWIELLLEVDAQAFPKFAQAILDGSKDSESGIDGFSMGCNVERSVCNICKNSATAPDEFCSHIRMKGRNHQYFDRESGMMKSAKSYENCYGVQFFEISGVFDPADETALVREVRASVNKEAELMTPGRVEIVKCPSCAKPAQFAPNAGFGTCGGCGYHITKGEAQPQLSGPLNNNRAVNPGAGPAFPNNPVQSHVKEADNPVPQSELIKAPSDVDTLREETVCPICGEKLEDGSCDLCGYIEPPEGFNNPDLSRAQEVQDQIPQESNPEGEAQKLIPAGPIPGQQFPGQPQQIGNPNTTQPPLLSHVKSDMQWKVVPHPRLAGRINSTERPVNPGNPASSNEPRETVLKDEVKPVTSHVRTAGDILASVGRDKENTMERVAEQSATPADASAAPDVRTDVTGVGGITDASNEQASKADAQVDVAAQGGTGVENVEADSHADNSATSDNAGFQPGGEVGDDTSTWSGTDGNGVTKQVSPVGGDVFPASDEGVKKSHDDKAFPEDDGGLAGGGAVKGVKPVAENFGERVDVLDHVTSPANNSGPTDQWTGTDGNGVLKQQDPVTTEVFAPWTSKVVAAMKLADLEVELGLLPESQKYARVAELGEQSDERVSAELAYAERVRTAGLKRAVRTAATQEKAATKLPVLGRPSQMRTTSVQTDDNDPLGGTLFGL